MPRLKYTVLLGHELESRTPVQFDLWCMSFGKTDTNDLAGGARRGKGAMVTSHTGFVLKEGAPGTFIGAER